MQENNDMDNKDVTPVEDTLTEEDLDQVSGGGHGHGQDKGQGHGKGNNKNNPALGDGSVRFINPSPGTIPSITDGTSNTIAFGEK